jgi:DnaK suppressor protein
MARKLAQSTLKRFRRMLEEEQERLIEVIREIEEEQEELRLSETSSERSPDPNTAEGGSLAFELEKELSLHQNAKNLLDQAEEALIRIDEGTYGICAECGEAIPVARLEALPHTKFCVTCSASRH